MFHRAKPKHQGVFAFYLSWRLSNHLHLRYCDFILSCLSFSVVKLPMNNLNQTNTAIFSFQFFGYMLCFRRNLFENVLVDLKLKSYNFECHLKVINIFDNLYGQVLTIFFNKSRQVSVTNNCLYTAMQPVEYLYKEFKMQQGVCLLFRYFHRFLS